MYKDEMSRSESKKRLVHYHRLLSKSRLLQMDSCKVDPEHPRALARNGGRSVGVLRAARTVRCFSLRD